MDAAHQVAAALLDAKAFKVSMDPLFTWTSGLKSPVYCDLRALNADVEGRRLIVDELVKLVPEDVDVIAGTATAGISWAAWVAEKMSKPMVYVRSKPKEHGAKKQVEGFVDNGAKVVMIEDLISTGGSSIRTVQALRDECDAVVTKVVAINTYEMAKATANFAEAGLELETVTTSPTIFAVARERGVITEEQEAMLQDFGSAPAEWAGKHGLS
ncbi:orotate phosphoribosyltransferase [Candidatus Peregrinibacteria bacterium]|jgi:orotate phosphoribosyltransferase|nr:orotate phosphoribosyltransferase [Candidatus Peregrinibacteria bacterium]MBT4631663.1 orotate phosphoribosyltransferase [Candidatus Peregrinibacteria bacterium]MBT5516791.1 orotate phosphoribosyltransferase [Candidatus Peregrinibacteria bacterium]MBT5823927.1 orotate phosphoribosyltransferase [Candidatus Peregrinibacteria bacterium]